MKGTSTAFLPLKLNIFISIKKKRKKKKGTSWSQVQFWITLEFKSHIMAVNSPCWKLSKMETWNMTISQRLTPGSTESSFLTEWLIHFNQSCPSPCSTWSSNEEHVSIFTQMLLCSPASCFKQETLCSDPGSWACLNTGL